MACKDKNRIKGLTLRDIALAALELDAAGGTGPVTWLDLAAKARDFAGRRSIGATASGSPTKTAECAA